MVRLVFSDSGLPLAVGIKLLTWSHWSHVSLLTPENEVIDSMWSRGGVTRYHFRELQKHAKRLEVREYPRLHPSMFEIAASQIGKPYDWTAIMGMPLRRNWQEDDSWFCTELMAFSALQAGTPLIHKETWRVTPQDLYQVEP